MDNAFRAAGVQSRTVHEIPAGFAAVGELVRHGLGTALHAQVGVPPVQRSAIIELSESVMWQVYLASPPVDRLTPAAAALAADADPGKRWQTTPTADA